MKSIRGAYIAQLDFALPELAGVHKKILGQVSALERSGLKVDTYWMQGSSITKNGEKFLSFRTGRLAKLFLHYYYFYMSLIGELRGVDVLYIRFQRSSPFFIRFLRKIKRNSKVLVYLEFPTFPYDTEAVTTREKILSFFDRATRPKLKYYIDRAVTFSRSADIFGIPAICTDNGVDADSLRKVKRPHFDNSLRLIGVANVSFWHGYDRVIAGIAEYNKQKNAVGVFFEIVGGGAELKKLEAQAEQLGVHHCVSFTGPLVGEDLDRRFDKSHLGISSLGMHRLDADTSNIKSREFCARGLPFLIGYSDEDFGGALEFKFECPPDDSAVNIKWLVDSYTSLLHQSPDYQQKMIRFAREKLTWDAKLSEVADSILSDIGVSKAS